MRIWACVPVESTDASRMQNTSASDSSEFTVAPCTRVEAEAGNATAQFGLAFSFAAGPVHDYDQALHWYFKAADQNHRLAQFNLGQMFAHGQGTERNDATAMMWIRRAADGGDAGAQFDLGNRCGRATVSGTDQDIMESRIESYKWFTLAAAQGYRNAVDRSDSATLRMTREEVTEGNRRVAAFVAA
jgi:uncharacterized protein